MEAYPPSVEVLGGKNVRENLPKALRTQALTALTNLHIAKDCLLTLVKSRLALGSPGCLFVCLFVTMLKMAQYTGKWMLTAP